MIFNKLSVLFVLVGSANASYDKIKSFTPLTSVTDHYAISADQTSMENLIDGHTQEAFENAARVFKEGGNSKSIAKIAITMDGGLPVGVTTSTKITATGQDGSSVIGTPNSSYDVGATSMEFKYPVKDNQDDHNSCRVGALPPNEIEEGGCLPATGSFGIEDVGQQVSFTYDPLTDNDNGRTLAGFSTDAYKRMKPGDNTNEDYFEIFQKFFDYYGKADYGHELVMSAFQKTDTSFTNGNVRLQSADSDFEAREEIAKKVSAYTIVSMYVIRELYDAIYDCRQDCELGDCNDDAAVHALDEAVAFYVGVDDNFMHLLGNKRCANFGTCSGDDFVSGDANANIEAFALFGEMQTALQQGNCDDANDLIDPIASKMWTMLVQGTLRYAWFADTTNNPGATATTKGQAEGMAFATGVLPMIHACDAEAAQTIYDNMQIQNPVSSNFPAVKEAFEKCYDQLGITCEDVGGLANNAGTSYDNELTLPCGGVRVLAMPEDSSSSFLTSSLAFFVASFTTMYFAFMN